MSVDVASIIEIETTAHVNERLDVLRRFLLGVLEDTTLLDGIPNDTILYLIPEEKPEFAERERIIGEANAERGRLVTFRPIRLADLPE